MPPREAKENVLDFGAIASGKKFTIATPKRDFPLFARRVSEGSPLTAWRQRLLGTALADFQGRELSLREVVTEEREKQAIQYHHAFR